MKVILTMDVDALGSRGDRVDVSAGYARNYLMPRRLAVADTRGNARVMAEEGKLAGVRDSKAQREAEKIASWLAEHELFTTLKIGREGKAFGAVTSKDLAILLRKAGLEVDRRRIRMDSPIKRLGVFDVPLAVHSSVDTIIKVFVDRDGGTKDGAVSQQGVYDEELRAAEEVAKAEAEARAEREREAEEVARVAIERAAARKAREEEEARAREEARKPQSEGEAAGDDASAPSEAEPSAAEEKAGESA